MGKLTLGCLCPTSSHCYRHGSHEGNEGWLAKAMTKGELLKSIATEHDMKTKDCSNILNSLVTVAAKEVKKTGVFTIPGLCRIKTRSKPATKACTKMIFGKETKVNAKPAKTVVK